MIERKFSFLIAAILMSSVVVVACNDDSPNNGKIDFTKVKEQCYKGDTCETDAECKDASSKQACACVRMEDACQKEARCKGAKDSEGKLCEYTCSIANGNCTWDVCKEDAACKTGQEPSGCDPEQLPNEGDYDKDGILNGIEKRFHYNPCEKDSDGDGFHDGLEDLNHNGVFEEDQVFGESNPLDANSVPDRASLDVRSQVCTLEKMRGETLNLDGNVYVAQFPNAKYERVGMTAVAINAEGVRGLIVSKPTEDNILSDFIVSSATKGVEGLSAVKTSSFVNDVPLSSWGSINPKLFQSEQKHFVQRVKYNIDIPPAMSLEDFRKRLAEHLEIEGLPEGSEAAQTCESGKASLNFSLAIYRSRLIYSLGLACETHLTQGSAVSNMMDDIIGSTMVSAGNFVPFQNFVCQTKSLGDATGAIDFLWVVDNSGSMEDEQENLGKTAVLFSDALKMAGIDARVAVTSTDAFLMEEIGYDLYDKGPYPYRVKPEGAAHPEGPGFNYSSQAFVNSLGIRPSFLSQGFTLGKDSQNFLKNIQRYEGCQSVSGKNLCGYGYEDGLSSAEMVLRRTSLSVEEFDDKRTICMRLTDQGYKLCGNSVAEPPAYCSNDSTEHYCVRHATADRCKARLASCDLRDGALKYIIWVSDEESRQFKEEAGIASVDSGVLKGGSGNLRWTARYCKTGPKLELSGDNWTMRRTKPENNDWQDADCNPSLIAESTKIKENMSLEEVKNASEPYYNMLNYYLQALWKLQGSGGIAAFALVGDTGEENDGVCKPLGSISSSKDGANYGLSYILMARFLGKGPNGDKKEGGFASICSTNYQNTVNAIIEDAIGRVASHPLIGYPIASTIRVAITREGNTTELKRGAKQDGWNYDASQNAIVFSFGDKQPEKDAQIAIAYVVWTKQQG